jgi:PST family polysaccharide transporter
MALFRTPISTAMLGGPEHGDLVLLMALATFSSMAAGVATGMLNAHHRVSALARLAILNSVLGAGISLALVWALRERGIALAIIAGTFVHFLIAYLLLSRNVTVDSSVQAALQDVLRSAKSLLQFGGPYTASMLVGTGVQLALPALIVHSLGTEGVGFYRAAVAVSINYLSFLLVSMGQDYYPRISAASNRPAELVHLVNQQHRLVMLLGAPMILGTLAMAPYLVPLIYSAEFTPTIELLEWQLIGDLFKFASWTMGYILLARNRTLSFFCAELSFGAAILATSWLSMQWFGLAGLGMAFVITYAVLYLINFLLVRHEIKFVLTLANQRILLSALAAALIVRALPFLGLEHWRTPLALTIALIAGLVSVTVIWREFARDAVKERIVVAD